MFFEIKHLFQTIININMIVISIIVALIIYFVDLPKLMKSGFIKDIKIAKCIFYIYLIVPTLVYVVLKFI